MSIRTAKVAAAGATAAKVAAAGATAAGFLALTAGFVAITPDPAQAGIYTWKHYATYGTPDECQSAGETIIRAGEADRYRCTGPDGAALYLGYIW